MTVIMICWPKNRTLIGVWIFVYLMWIVSHWITYDHFK